MVLFAFHLQPTYDMCADLHQTKSGASLVVAVGYALMLHLRKVPWLAKDIIWVMPDASCGLMDSMEAWVATYQTLVSPCILESHTCAANCSNANRPVLNIGTWSGCHSCCLACAQHKS